MFYHPTSGRHAGVVLAFVLYFEGLAGATLAIQATAPPLFASVFG